MSARRASTNAHSVERTQLYVLNYYCKTFIASNDCRLMCSRRSIKLKAQARAARRRHHRFRHGQSGPAGAAAHRRQARARRSPSPRTNRYSASRGIPGLRTRAGRLLRAPLRREAQSRHAGRRDARLQGRLRQPGAGDHGAGRCHPLAEPVLPDPRVRLHHGRRRRSARSPAHSPDADIMAALDRAVRHSHAAADRDGAELSGQPDRACRRSRFLQGGRRLREASTT